MAMNKQNEIELADDQEEKPAESNHDQTKDYVNNEDIILLVEEDKNLLDVLIRGKEYYKKRGVQLEQEDYKIRTASLSFDCKNLPVGPILGADFSYDDSVWIKEEEFKVRLAAKFMELFIDDKNEESLFKEIRKNIPNLRKCFGSWEMYKYDDAFLARLLFLDGCAVLQFIHSYVQNELEKLEISNNQASEIVDELFNLNNQIPFKVLELLMKLTNNPNQLKNDIVKFLHMSNMVAPMNDLSDRKQRTDILQIKNRNVHLLDLLHTLILLGIEDVGGNTNNNNNNNKYLPSCYNQQDIKDCLPHFDCCCRRKSSANNDSLRTRHHDYKRFFRNVHELKSAGIEFKPGRSFAISFKSGCFNIRGYLSLPPIIVDEWTERRLLNMVGYEMSLSGSAKKNCYIIASYIKFMDFLIDRERDVKELRASRIIWNRLSTDKEVADLFNELGSRCLEPPQDVYSNVKTEIQRHCERKCAVWMAQVYHQHFSSPWTMVALLAAAIVLSLTAIQTWYAVHPKN